MPTMFKMRDSLPARTKANVTISHAQSRCGTARLVLPQGGGGREGASPRYISIPRCLEVREAATRA